MGSPGRHARAWAVAALCAGCRVHFDQIETGGSWTTESVQSLSAEGDTRAEVLGRLGPPDAVTYTLKEEILVYRRGVHRGTELRFLIPDPFVNTLRPGLEELSPKLQGEEAFDSQSRAITLAETMIEVLFGILNPLGTEEALAFQGRQLRWDVARIVLDRATRRTQRVELFLGIDYGEARRLTRPGPADRGGA